MTVKYDLVEEYEPGSRTAILTAAGAAKLIKTDPQEARRNNAAPNWNETLVLESGAKLIRMEDGRYKISGYLPEGRDVRKELEKIGYDFPEAGQQKAA